MVINRGSYLIGEYLNCKARALENEGLKIVNSRVKIHKPFEFDPTGNIKKAEGIMRKWEDDRKNKRGKKSKVRKK